LEIVEKDNFYKYERTILNNPKYKESPLKDEKIGFKTYPGLKELEFYIYIFEEKSEIEKKKF